MPVAPWREIRTPDELRHAAGALGLPLRVKATTGGYDGRSQVRVECDRGRRRRPRPTRPSGRRGPAGRGRDGLRRRRCRSSLTRGLDGRCATFPLARNRHDAGILAEIRGARTGPRRDRRACRAIGERLAVAMDLVGTLTAELFLMPDGQLVVNELAPRVHNSGHWTIEGAATSQFEQHIRAICGLDLGSTAALAPSAMVNLLGTGPPRPARLEADGLGRCAGRSGRPSPSLRQAPRLRTSQDGARHRARIHRG